MRSGVEMAQLVGRSPRLREVGCSSGPFGREFGCSGLAMAQLVGRSSRLREVGCSDGPFGRVLAYEWSGVQIFRPSQTCRKE